MLPPKATKWSENQSVSKAVPNQRANKQLCPKYFLERLKVRLLPKEQQSDIQFLEKQFENNESIVPSMYVPFELSNETKIAHVSLQGRRSVRKAD